MRLILIVLVFVSLTLLSYRSISSSQLDRQHRAEGEVSQQQPEIDLSTLKINNRTRVLDSIQVEKADNESVRVKFQNISRKRITAVQLSFGNVTVGDEFIYDETRYIAPGQFYNKTFPPQPNIAKGVAILAVLFDDGTGDGDPTYIKQVVDSRLARKIQYDIFLAKLKELENVPDQEITTALDGLNNEIYKSSNKDGNQSMAVSSGTKAAQRMISKEITLLKNIQQKGRPIRPMLKEERDYFQKLSDQLKVHTSNKVQ
jgi:hypothetical protein